MEKECRSCRVTKPATEFYANSQKKDGLGSYCRDCSKAKIKAAYVRRPPKERPPEGMKKCSQCKETKPTADFGVHSKTPDGLQYYCKLCQVASVTKSRHKNPASHRRSSKAWRERSPENQHRHYENSVRHRIGKHVEHGTYARLFAAQEGRCAICKSSDPGNIRTQRLHLDHCHETNVVRGLLCTNCNRLLGAARDSIPTLEEAVRYLATFLPASAEGG